MKSAIENFEQTLGEIGPLRLFRSGNRRPGHAAGDHAGSTGNYRSAGAASSQHARNRNPVRGGGISQRPRPGHAFGRDRRHRAWLQGGYRQRPPVDLPDRWLAGPGGQCLWRADGCARPVAGGARAAFLRNSPPAAHLRQRMGGKMDVGHPRDERLFDPLQGPAHGHFRRLGRRQIDPCCRCWRAMPPPTST